jgi:hypothetical protein
MACKETRQGVKKLYTFVESQLESWLIFLGIPEADLGIGLAPISLIEFI